MVSLQYSALKQRYWAGLYLSHAWRDIVAVFGIAVEVFGVSVSYSGLVRYSCGIRHCSRDVLHRWILLTTGVISLQYWVSQQRYLTSLNLPHTWPGIVVVFCLAAEVFGVSVSCSQSMVASPVSRM